MEFRLYRYISVRWEIYFFRLMLMTLCGNSKSVAIAELITRSGCPLFLRPNNFWMFTFVYFTISFFFATCRPMHASWWACSHPRTTTWIIIPQSAGWRNSCRLSKFCATSLNRKTSSSKVKWNWKLERMLLSRTRLLRIRRHPSASGNRPAIFTSKIPHRRRKRSAAGAAASAVWTKSPAPQVRPAARDRAVPAARPAVTTRPPLFRKMQHPKRIIPHRSSASSNPSFQSTLTTKKRITTCTDLVIRPPYGIRLVRKNIRYILFFF